MIPMKKPFTEDEQERLWAENLLQLIISIPEESQTIEIKRLSGEKVVKKTIKTIVAMANAEGGTIILGIDDPEKTKLKGGARVFGIEENNELYDEILREAARIVPPIVLNPVSVKTPDGTKTVVLLNVEKSVSGFHSIDNGVYIRLVKGNKTLTPAEIVKMSYAKGFDKADSELVEVNIKLLDTTHYREWANNRRISGDIEDVLLKTGLAKKLGHKILPTRAAVLLFADYPTDLMETKCAIKIMQYSDNLEEFGNVPNMIGVPKILNAPVVKLIEQAHDYVLTLLRTGVELHSGFTTKYIIPERAIKEAITNAVIHRDYYIKRDIEIKVFGDRVEITSPGLLPYNITTQNIGFVRADGYRNDQLVKHMREFPNPPNFDQNEGVVAMRNEMRKHGLYQPIFQSYPQINDSVRVVLLNEHVPSEWENVKKYLDENRYINNRKAREITGVVQMHRMSRMLSKWVAQGLLLKIIPNDSPKNTTYKLVDRGELNSSQ